MTQASASTHATCSCCVMSATMPYTDVSGRQAGAATPTTAQGMWWQWECLEKVENGEPSPRGEIFRRGPNDPRPTLACDKSNFTGRVE